MDKCPLQINEKGSVLVAMYGANIGEVGILEIEATTNQAVCACKTYTNFYENYLLYLITSLKPYFLSQGAGAAQPNISREKIVATIFPLPPLPEQHRIVARIDQLMARCDALENLRKEREEKRLAVHAAAVKQLLDTSSSPAQPPSSPPRRRGSSTSDSLDSRLRGNDGIKDAWDFIQQHFGELYTVKENVAELRKAILQLSVMGRLVPQNPNDPPASELLKEIEAEKQRLVKAGKIKKPKPLPSIKPEEVPYELPQGWEWVRLGEIAEFINGDRGKNYPNREEYVPEGIPWINTGHIEPDGSLTRRDMYFITREKFESLNGGKIQLGDLVYCLRGATFGKTAIVAPYAEGAIASSLMIIRPYAPISNRYVYQYLIGPVGRSQIFRFDNGSAQPNLSANSVRLYVYPLPPLPEQHRLVARIDQLMALCDTLDQQIEAASTKQTKLLNAVMAQV